MTYNEFKESIVKGHIPVGICQELVALWIEARGDWDKAHQIVQSMNSRNAAWVHAYLHRKEPDDWNASYWYSVAGRSKPDKGKSFEAEWEEIVKSLL